MIAYDKGDVPRIQHFIKVYSFAHMIGELEDISGVELLVLDIAAILHDIGIHPAEEKYGSSNGKYQEELGPDEARKLLSEFDLSGSMIDRICYLIGHHHTYTNVQGMDYQILLEADFLVNAFEEKMSKEAILSFRN